MIRGPNPRNRSTKSKLRQRPGIKIVEDVLGMGEEVKRRRYYRMSLRAWLNRGEPVVWTKPFGLFDEGYVSDDGKTMTADYRYDRVFLIAGLFYGIEGMRIGGKRA